MNTLIARHPDSVHGLLARVLESNPTGATFKLDLTPADPWPRSMIAEAPTTGYIVGGKGRAWVQNTRPTAADLYDFTAAVGPHWIGYWRDTATGKWWIDAVTHHPDHTDALLAAMHRGEIAFWDVQAAREVRVAQARAEDPRPLYKPLRDMEAA